LGSPYQPADATTVPDAGTDPTIAPGVTVELVTSVFAYAARTVAVVSVDVESDPPRSFTRASDPRVSLVDDPLSAMVVDDDEPLAAWG
jgi:hypothetical protein